MLSFSSADTSIKGELDEADVIRRTKRCISLLNHRLVVCRLESSFQV